VLRMFPQHCNVIRQTFLIQYIQYNFFVELKYIEALLLQTYNAVIGSDVYFLG